MKRYSITLTSMQWAIIGLDLSKLPEPEDSTQALKSLIRVALEHVNDPDEVDLPMNVEEA